MYARTDEADAVVAVAAAYYTAMVDGDAAELRRVFHSQASVIGHENGDFFFDSLDDFIATPGAKTGDQPFDYRVDALVLVGDTAVITVSGYCYGARYTDHLSMVKVDGAWRIVAKTYYRHPQT